MFHKEGGDGGNASARSVDYTLRVDLEQQNHGKVESHGRVCLILQLFRYALPVAEQQLPERRVLKYVLLPPACGTQPPPP